MKPLFTKSARDRVINSKNSPTAFGSRYGHQMIPLSGHDKTKPKFTYNVQATGNHRVGSEKHIISHKGGVIEYESVAYVWSEARARAPGAVYISNYARWSI